MSFSFIHSFLENDRLTFVERKRGLGWQVKYALEIMAHDFQSLLSALCGHCQRGVLIPFLCSEMSVKIIPATPFSISIIIAIITICRDKLVSGVHIYYYYRIELWWCVKLEGRKWKCSCYFDSLKQTCMRDVSVWCLWGLLLWPGFS